MPVFLWAQDKTTSGHKVGPCHVISGQSILTAASANPTAKRTRGITLVGGCTAEDVYYGVNLANNGDTVRGAIRVGRAYRAVFIYGAQDVEIDVSMDAGLASSANLLISNTGAGTPPTRDVTVRAVIGELNGAIGIVDQPSANGSGTYDNITLDATVRKLGTNLDSTVPLVRIGAYDANGEYFIVEKTMVTRNLDVRLNLGPDVPKMDSAVKVYTPSPNHGRLRLNRGSQYSRQDLFPKNASGVYMGPVLDVDGKLWRSVSSNLTDAGAVVFLPAWALSNVAKNGEVCALLRVTARSGVGAGSSYTIKQYLLMGDLSGEGVYRHISATVIGSASEGTACTIQIAPEATGAGLNVTGDSYFNAGAQLTASVEFV